jgi:16S rRNA processing protein RimM
MKPISELNLIKIGKIQKTRGYKGEVFIELYSEMILNTETEHIFMEIDGYMVPFFFSEKPKTQKNGMIAKFDTVTNEKEADDLIGRFAYSLENQIIYPEKDRFDQIEGFKVFNRSNYIGTASGFLNIPSNPILEVMDQDGNEILIPWNDEFLLKIDSKEQIILCDLPDGLIDINRYG